MPPVPGCNWDTKPYYNRTAKANQLKGANDRVSKKPQNNITHREQHDECECAGRNHMHPIAQPQDKILKSSHSTSSVLDKCLPFHFCQNNLQIFKNFLEIFHE
jgi:hypothetical protein